MSSAPARTPRTIDAVDAARQDRAVEARADALVGELRKIRAEIDAALRATEAAQSRRPRIAA